MLAQFPAAEQAELADYFREYGADAETGARMAAAVSKDPTTALRVHTREELGVDHAELPSPVLAGVASLFAFSLGALVPLLPYLIGFPVLAITLVVTAVALAAGGMIVGKLTGRCCARVCASWSSAAWPSRSRSRSAASSAITPADHCVPGLTGSAER